MNLTKLSIKRPVSVLMCITMLLVFGITSVFSMGLESTPEMSAPVFMVRTSYTDVSPEEMDLLITDKIEAALSAVSGYTSMTSRSSEGSAMTMLEFDYSADMDEIYQEIQEAIAAVNLPDDAGEPTIMEMSMDSDSVMSLSIDSTGDESLLTYIDQEVVPKLENISGVSQVDVSGGKKEYIQVRLKEEEMTQYGLTPSSIASAISTANFTTSAGTINRGDIELSLVGSASYETADSLKEIPLSLSSGDIIHLSDVADVQMAEQESTSVSRQNGIDNIGIDISKNQSANTVTLCNLIKTQVDKLNASNLGLTIEITDNSGETIMDNIQNVIESLLEGLVISMFVLLIFLGEPKSSLIIATSMPLSVFSALVLMSVCGMTINIMSLGGLVVGIGMMVDNSIVVMESCFQQRNGERTYEEAAFEAARLVGSSVIASTITTIVVFLPISLMSGMAGQLFKQVGFTIVFSLVASLISALTLVPLLFVRVKPVDKKEILAAKMLHKVEDAYANAMGAIFKHKFTVVIVAVALLAFTGWMYTNIDQELMTRQDEGSISLSIETKQGLNVTATDKIMQQIEDIIKAESDIDSYSLRSMGGSSSLSITLKDERSMETDEMIEKLREETSNIENCYIEVSQQSSMSFGSSDGVSISVKGGNLNTLKEVANEIKNSMQGYDGIISADTSLSNGDPQAEIVVDSVQAAAIGMTPSQVVSNVKNMVSGITATTLQDGDTEYSVVVEYPPERFYDASDLSGLLITTSSGGQVPLTDIASIVYANGPSQIQRSDGKYIVTVTGQTKTKASTTALSKQMISDFEKMDLPDGVTLSQGETMRMMKDEFSNIGNAMWTSIFLVFVVMAMQFESMIFSLVVMISVPFALTGAFAALLITGMSISMSSLIGLVMLVGTVVNAAIILIDYANILRREQGLSPEEACKAAGKSRLRPILLTVMTTVLSLIPMAAGIGGGVATMQSLAVVVIGGLTFSTLITLFLVPTFYLMFDWERHEQRKQQRRMKKLLRKQEKAKAVSSN